ncbi:MAG: hypothetical protein ACOYL5_16770, partial [Phototrophicaceae bacterium]
LYLKMPYRLSISFGSGIEGEGLVFVPLRPQGAKGLGDEGVFAPKPECTPHQSLCFGLATFALY